MMSPIGLRTLEESLRRLKTDHLDVWQIHEVVYYNDPDLIFAPGGRGRSALLLAKQQGKVRGIKIRPLETVRVAVADSNSEDFVPLGPDPLNIDRAIWRIHIRGQDDEKF
jgi:aryl-alcohol dehydrogenase-like predicted oxidoreductase